MFLICLAFSWAPPALQLLIAAVCGSTFLVNCNNAILCVTQANWHNSHFDYPTFLSINLIQVRRRPFYSAAPQD
jgi:hypothetical protein